MLIYPVSVVVTQAKVQLITDEAAKAPVTTISSDMQAVAAVQREAEQASLIDRKA
jgi:cell shape-determining protein MreC